MLKENTRQAIAIEIMTSLRGNDAVKTVKAAREIFHQEWSNDDMELMCEHIKNHGVSDWAIESWENNTDQIYKQLHLATIKAIDFQLVMWLKKILGGEKALKFLCSCEDELN